MTETTPRRYADQDVDLDSEGFLADMVGLLAETLEETVGLEEAASFLAAVGGELGSRISSQYGDVADDAGGEDVPFDIADVCVDLKARIGGTFTVESVEPGRITFVNTRCPFGARVKGRPSLCMMTTNVFGRVAADRNGYAAVHVDKAIAAGDPGCRVVVSLERNAESVGHEFFG